MSPHRFTKNTIEASFWCNKCAKPTMHAVNDGRRGSCLACIKRLEQASIPGMEKPKEPEQMTLIERYGGVDIG